MIEMVKEKLLGGIICCDIDPQTANAFDRGDEELLAIDNGTESCPWMTLRPDDPDYTDQSAPLPCQDKPGCWHYVVVC